MFLSREGLHFPCSSFYHQHVYRSFILLPLISPSRFNSVWTLAFLTWSPAAWTISLYSAQAACPCFHPPWASCPALYSSPVPLVLQRVGETENKTTGKKQPGACPLSFTHSICIVAKTWMYVLGVKQAYPFSNDARLGIFNFNGVTLSPWQVDRFHCTVISKNYV